MANLGDYVEEHKNQPFETYISSKSTHETGEEAARLYRQQQRKETYAKLKKVGKGIFTGIGKIGDKLSYKETPQQQEFRQRGFALIHMPINNIYTSDPWDLKNNMKIETSWTKAGIYKPKYAQLTTVVGYVKYSDLTENQREEIEAIKKEKRNKVFNNNEEKTDPENMFYNKLIEKLKAGRINPDMLKEICSINGKSYNYVRIKLNKILSEQNDNNKVEDYCKQKEKLKKRDIFGFVHKETLNGNDGVFVENG